MQHAVRKTARRLSDARPCVETPSRDGALAFAPTADGSTTGHTLRLMTPVPTTTASLRPLAWTAPPPPPPMSFVQLALAGATAAMAFTVKVTAACLLLSHV